MKYKNDDKIVIKIDEIDAINLNRGHGTNFCAEQFLGKLEDFTKPKKIKMTVEEKKEFDELKKTSKALYLAFFKIAPVDYPRLAYCLFGGTSSENNRNQLGFARAWGNPELIEVEKPEKYYVHLFPGKYGYLNKLINNGNYTISSKDDMDDFQAKFTKEEIDKIQQDALKITDKALEEVEKDEDDI